MNIITNTVVIEKKIFKKRLGYKCLSSGYTQIFVIFVKQQKIKTNVLKKQNKS